MQMDHRPEVVTLGVDGESVAGELTEEHRIQTMESPTPNQNGPVHGRKWEDWGGVARIWS